MNYSICLIARNEEETLPRLIGSLKEFQDRGGDIWLLDTGSTDSTIKVAEGLGCNVVPVGEMFVTTIDEKLCEDLNKQFVVEDDAPIVKVGDKLFDYASARNYIAAFSKTDMIATPDCDEIFTKFDIDKLNEEIEKGAEQFEYNFVFAHDQYGAETIKFAHSKFYNHKKMKWVGIIHEVLQGDVKRVHLGEEFIKLEHFQNEKTNRTGYLRGLALDCYLHPNNDRNSHYLGRELFYTGRYKSAISQLQKHILLNAWITERAQSMIYIGDCYIALGDEKHGLEYYNKSFLLDSGRREAPIRLAKYFYSKQDAQKTACYAAMALQIPWGSFYSNNASHYAEYPHELMYWALWNLKDLAGSKEHWQKAFGFQPHSDKYLHDARFYINLPKVSFVIPTLGREEGLQKCIDSIKKLNYPQDKIEIIVKQDSFEDNKGVPILVKEGYEESTGDFIVFASNDVVFTPNSLIEAFLNQSGGFCAFNTGTVLPDEGNICEHFMISKTIVERIGEIFDTEFHHVGVDNLLWAKMKKIGIAKRVDSAIVTHNHFSKGAEFDDVYKKGWELFEQDRQLLAIKLKDLESSEI